jgi:hypothetical protein
MKIKHSILPKISLCLGLAIALGFISGCASSSDKPDHMNMQNSEHEKMINEQK